MATKPLWLLLSCCLAGLALVVVACGGGAAKADRPNILLIISDDQRYDTMGEYMPQTQARIFDQGVTFENAFVTTPLCCPSRSSILTGMYAHNTGVHDNKIELHKTTFVQRLKDDGYFTGLVGKYLNSWDFRKPRPEFDYWVSDPPGSNEYFNAHINVNGKAIHAPYYITRMLEVYNQEFMRQALKQDKPFLLIFAPPNPHPPALPAPGDEKLYADLPPYRPPSYNEPDVSDKPLWLQGKPPFTPAKLEELDQFRLNQLRSLREVDRADDKLLTQLEQAGQLDNTIVIYISDNGYFWGEHRLEDKVFPYEEAVHVPMAIRYPKLTKQPKVEQALVGNIDLAPTIYELAGIDIPSDVDGQSLVPLLKGSGKLRDELMIEGWPGFGHYAGVRTDRYMYIETDGDLPELYDMQADPYQIDNKAADPAYANIVGDLKGRLRKVAGPTATPSPSATLPP